MAESYWPAFRLTNPTDPLEHYKRECRLRNIGLTTDKYAKLLRAIDVAGRPMHSQEIAEAADVPAREVSGLLCVMRDVGLLESERLPVHLPTGKTKCNMWRKAE